MVGHGVFGTDQEQYVAGKINCKSLTWRGNISISAWKTCNVGGWEMEIH
jgi:hypothetical protein